MPVTAATDSYTGWNAQGDRYTSRDGNWRIYPAPGNNQLWHLVDQRKTPEVSAGCYSNPSEAMRVARAKEESARSVTDELEEYIKTASAADPAFALELEIGEVEDNLYRDMRAKFPNGDMTAQAQWASDMAPTIHRYIKNAEAKRDGKTS